MIVPDPEQCYTSLVANIKPNFEVRAFDSVLTTPKNRKHPRTTPIYLRTTPPLPVPLLLLRIFTLSLSLSLSLPLSHSL